MNAIDLLRMFDEVRVRVEHSYHDHRRVDELVARLSNLPNGPREHESAALVTRLALAVEQHISHDEQLLLPQAERLLGPSRLQELFYEMDEARTHQSDRDSMIYSASRLGPAK
jgi:hemerythrin-like domain-containing protein